jgi:hypothetical protein
MKQFLLGPGSETPIFADWNSHALHAENINTIQVDKGATLIANDTQAQVLDYDIIGMTIKADGNVTIKAGKSDIFDDNQTFVVEGTGTHAIIAGDGADNIVLGARSGTDILFFDDVNDSTLGTELGEHGQLHWQVEATNHSTGQQTHEADVKAKYQNYSHDKVYNFDKANDKLVFATDDLPVENPTDNSIPTAKIIIPTVNKDTNFTVTDSSHTFTATNGIIDGKELAGGTTVATMSAILTALDTEIANGTSSNPAVKAYSMVNSANPMLLPTLVDAYTANNIWAFDDGVNTYILRADGMTGTAGDTVIELVGVTGVTQADLMRMLTVNIAIEWGAPSIQP